MPNGGKARAARWKTSQTLEALVYSFPLAVLALSADALVQIWNPAAERLFGWRQRDVLGRRMPIVPPDRQDEFQNLFRRALAGEEFRDLELVRKRNDGLLIDVSATTAPLLAVDGSVLGVIAIYKDLTWQKEAEAELRQRFRQLSALYDASRAFLQPADPNRTLDTACRLIEERFGLQEAWIGLVSTDGTELLPIAGHSLDPAHLNPLHLEDAHKHGEPVVAAVRTQRPVTRDGTGKAPAYPAWATEGWSHFCPSSAAVPIISRERILGVLSVCSDEPGHFTRDRLQVLESFANLTAVALEAARLREQAIRHAAELEERVRERTADLERFVIAMTGRELRIAELEETVRSLTDQLAQEKLRLDPDGTASS